MSEIRLFIARHGETEFNRKGLLQGRGIDEPLNETGWQQAHSLASYLEKYRADALYSSSLKRSWQTAEPLQKLSELEILQKMDLDEMDFGKYEGTPYMDVSGELTELQRVWESGEVTRAIPGGESPQDVFERANGEVRSIMDSFTGKTMVLILHGRLIRILLSEWLGYGLRNMQKIEHQNGSVYQLVYDGDFKPVYLNKSDHLQISPELE
jgi:broad specificity phosphatase PhoE